jgi:hypothetical protein
MLFDVKSVKQGDGSELRPLRRMGLSQSHHWSAPFPAIGRAVSAVDVSAGLTGYTLAEVLAYYPAPVWSRLERAGDGWYGEMPF